MQHDIGTRPVDIALPSYRGAGVNDGSTRDLAALYGSSRAPVLVSFVNAGAAQAKAWLALLPGIKSAACGVFVVVFRHDGSSFQACDADADAASMVREAGGDDAFQSIPVVVDADGAVAKAYLFGLPTPPANKDAWSYLLDPAFLIADKWHTSAVSPAYPISFKHLRLDPDPGPFNGGVPENARAYVLKRIANLNAPLSILGAKPAPGSLVRSSTEIRKVFFSRPLLEASVTPDKFMLTGPGLVGGPVKAVSASYQGYERAEDGVLLNFPAGPSFKGAGPESVVLVVSDSPSGVLDTGRGPLSGSNAVKFATEAAFTPAVPIETPPPRPAFTKPVIRDETRKPEPRPRPEKPEAVREGAGGMPKPQPRKPPEPAPAKPAPKKAVPKAKKPVKKAAKKIVKKAAKKAVKKAKAKKAVKKAAGKAPVKKVVKKKAAVKKAPAKKSSKKAVKKAAAKKAVKKTVKKPAAKKTVAKKPAAKKPPAKKAAAAKKGKPAKKTGAKKAGKKK